jgi:AraC-like DNA-binding protein
MRFMLDPPEQTRACSQDWAPPDLGKWILPFARINYTSGLFGRILSQEISLPEYTLWYHRFFIDSAIGVQLETDETLSTLHYMLKGRLQCQLTGFGTVRLSKGTYQLYGLPARLSHHAWFEPGEYCSFHIGLSGDTILQIALQYQLFKGMMETLGELSAGVTLKVLFRMNRKINRAIDEILSCRQEKMKRSFYLKERISILVNAWLEDLESFERNRLWADSRVVKLNELENFIKANLGAHADVLSLDNLARICGMSSRQFHESYSILYQLPIDDLVKSLKMKKALELLKEGGHSIGEIAEKLGYADRGNFTRAFKKYYGETPGFYLK